MSLSHQTSSNTLCVLLLLFTLIASTPCSTAEDKPRVSLSGKKVLVLHSFEYSQPAYKIIDGALIEAFVAGGLDFNNLYFECLDLARNPGQEYRDELAQLFRNKFNRRKLDLILTLHQEALQFLLEEGQEVYPEGPIISILGDSTFPEHSDLNHTIIHLPFSVDVISTANGILNLKRDTRKIVVVSGSSALDRRFDDFVMTRLKPWKRDLEVESLPPLPLVEILEKVANLPAGTAILYTTVYADSTQRTYMPRDVVRMISKAANAPVFGLFQTLLGDNGIVGGTLLNHRVEGERAAQLALEVLQGKQAQKTFTILPAPLIPMFDWPQLKRWGFRESDLPSNAVILNKPLPPWDLYRFYSIGGLAFLILQFLLIASWLVHKRRRRSAEDSPLQNTATLKDRLKFETLLADVSSRLVDVPVGQMDSAIRDCQRLICENLIADRSVLWQVPDQDPKSLLLTHIYQPQGSLATPDRMNARDFFPWSLQKVLAGEVTAISRISDLPPEADLDRESYIHYGTKSTLLIPLSVGGGPVFGVLTFSEMQEERVWPEEFVKNTQVVAQVFANALARERTNRDLRESEARLSLATNAAGAGLWIMDLDTREIWVSEKTRELHFLQGEAVTFESFYKAIHPDDYEKVRGAITEALRSGEDLWVEYRVVMPSGEMRWIVARGQCYPGEGPVRLMGVSLDISERKRAEQEVIEHLEFERLLSDLSAEFATLSGEVDANITGALEKIRGFFKSDRIGLLTVSSDKTSWLISHAVSAEGVPSFPVQTELPRLLLPWYFAKIVDQREVVSVGTLEELPREADVDKQILMKWGIQSNLSIPLAAGGKTGCMSITAEGSEHRWPEKYIPRLRMIGNVLLNALERKELEQRIRRSAKEWQATFDSIPDVTMILDRDLRVVRHNAAAVPFFNLPAHEILGRHCHELMHEGKGQPFDCPVKRSFVTTDHQESEIYDAERKAWYLLSSDPIFDGQGQIVWIVHRVKDITLQKKGEVENLSLRRELQRSERKLRMGELTASLAHELNQPLTSILSNANAALRFIETDRLSVEELKEILQDIADDDRRAGEIIRSLRSMFKGEEGERGPVAINLLLREVTELFKSEAVIRNLKLELELTDPLPPVPINKVQVQQVVINLIMNAAEAIAEASGDRRITLRTHRCDKGFVQVAVSDTGSGLADDDLSKIFEPFFSKKGSGLGMGLSISRNIVQDHGGRIWAKNNPEKGATFFFDLPAMGDGGPV